MTTFEFEQAIIGILGNYTLDDTTGCHNYNGNLDPGVGYGRIMIDSRRYHTHRLSAYIYLGLDLDNPTEFACHKCDNRRCVNPEHLYIGTNRQNQLDVVKDTCKAGHPLVGYNAMIRRRSNGETFRNCRICHNIRGAKNRAKKMKG